MCHSSYFNRGTIYLSTIILTWIEKEKKPTMSNDLHLQVADRSNVIPKIRNSAFTSGRW